MGPLGRILVSFGRSWALLGLSLGLFGDGWNFDTFPPQNPRPFWVPFWYPISQKSRKCSKKLCSKSGVEKMRSQSTSETAKCVIRAVNTICSERSDILQLSGFWSPFGSLLDFFVLFAKKCDSRPQKTHEQNISKISENRCCE